MSAKNTSWPKKSSSPSNVVFANIYQNLKKPLDVSYQLDIIKSTDLSLSSSRFDCKFTLKEGIAKMICYIKINVQDPFPINNQGSVWNWKESFDVDPWLEWEDRAVVTGCAMQRADTLFVCLLCVYYVFYMPYVPGRSSSRLPSSPFQNYFFWALYIFTSWSLVPCLARSTFRKAPGREEMWKEALLPQTQIWW